MNEKQRAGVEAFCRFTQEQQWADLDRGQQEISQEQSVPTPITADKLALFKLDLGQFFRIKHSTDYSYTWKYGELRITCAAVFKDTIAKVAAEHELTIHEWFTY